MGVNVHRDGDEDGDVDREGFSDELDGCCESISDGDALGRTDGESDPVPEGDADCVAVGL